MEQLETSEEAKARGANSVSFSMLAVVLASLNSCRRFHYLVVQGKFCFKLCFYLFFYLSCR